MPTTITCFKPGENVFVVHQNRIHSAEIVGATIGVSATFHNPIIVNKTYSVKFTSNRTGNKLDIPDDDIAATREELVAKL